MAKANEVLVNFEKSAIDFSVYPYANKFPQEVKNMIADILNDSKVSDFFKEGGMDLSDKSDLKRALQWLATSISRKKVKSDTVVFIKNKDAGIDKKIALSGDVKF